MNKILFKSTPVGFKVDITPIFLNHVKESVTKKISINFITAFCLFIYLQSHLKVKIRSKQLTSLSFCGSSKLS